MATNKKSFLLYCDIINMVEQLPNDKAGELFKHILNYVNDKNPVTDDLIINISFEPIKQALKRDLKKYESICSRNKINGLGGGRPKNPEEPKKPTGLFGNPEEPKKPDIDIDIDIDIEKNNIIPYDEIVNLFNSICISLSKVSKCTESRKVKIKTRYNEIGGIEKIKELFLMVQSSSFLKGENKENWKATFDWLFENDKNWVKVMEGNYNKTQQNNNTPRRIDKYEAFGMRRDD